jgi:hypothetical protein
MEPPGTSEADLETCVPTISRHTQGRLELRTLMERLIYVFCEGDSEAGGARGFAKVDGSAGRGRSTFSIDVRSGVDAGEATVGATGAES